MSSAPRVILHKKSVRPVTGGHPWVFSGAIARTVGVDASTTNVLVCDGDTVLGQGFYSPQSQIRVRMFSLASQASHAGDNKPESIDAAFFARRITEALRRRQRFGLPSQETTGFRLLNSEGDSLPGAVVDLWGRLATFQLTTWPLIQHREAFVAGLKEALAGIDDLAILEVAAPKAMAQREGFRAEERWWQRGDPFPEEVRFQENGLTFSVLTEEFQKTGHYADMRQHRLWVAERTRGARVLDGYSYTGAFGLAAAHHGAEHVVCVDSSGPAIAGVRRNAEINGLTERIDAQESKVDDYLRSAYDRGVRFDTIVLDPPKLAPRRKHVPKALKLYEALSVQAMRLLEEDGLFALGSCSEAIGPEELERVIGTAAARVGRLASIVYQGMQSPDHPTPATMSEARYLTFMAAQLRY